MTAVTCVALVCVTVVFLALRLEAFADRLLTVVQRHLAPRPSAEAVPIPADLERWCNLESETWAREEARQFLREKYAEVDGATPDERWQQVRALLPEGAIEQAEMAVLTE